MYYVSYSPGFTVVLLSLFFFLVFFCCCSPFNVLADNLEPFSSQDFDEISRRVSDREGITFYQCPNLRKPDPVVTYPVLPQVVEVYCVPAEDVELAEFSLGGFRRSTTLKTSNTVPLLER